MPLSLLILFLQFLKHSKIIYSCNPEIWFLYKQKVCLYNENIIIVKSSQDKCKHSFKPSSKCFCQNLLELSFIIILWNYQINHEETCHAWLCFPLIFNLIGTGFISYDLTLNKTLPLVGATETILHTCPIHWT